MNIKKSILLILSEVTIFKNARDEYIRNARNGRSCCKLNLEEITKKAGVISAIDTDIKDRKLLSDSFLVKK
jgi:hypothetical protein